MDIYTSLLVFLLMTGAEPWRIHAPPKDPMGENLFPPELVMQFQEQIGLSPEQRQDITSALQENGPKFEKLHQRMQQEIGALDLVLKKDRVSSEPALAQFDKLQDLEREARRAQLGLMIRLKNILSPEQQARLQEIKKQQKPGGAFGPNLPPPLQDKLQKLQAGVQQWKKNGWDPSPIDRAMQKIKGLIKAQQFQEAEEVLDDALALLAKGAKERL